MLNPLPLNGIAFDDDGTPLPLLDLEGLAAAHWDIEPGLPGAAHPPVLVVDDSLSTRMLLKNVLAQAGFQVDTARSGEEALQMAQSKSYGLFMVDVDMPGMDGFEFVSRSRSDPRLSHIPSIIVSARDSRNDRRKGLQSGAMGYIAKNRFDSNELLELVEGLLP